MAKPSAAARPLVVCSLQFECRWLQRAGVRRLADLVCIGPGPERIESWAKSVGPTHRPIILAGLAGALRPGVAEGSVWTITGVVDDGDGRRWTPSLLEAFGRPSWESCAVTSAPRTLTTPRDKRRYQLSTEADLVDCESVAIARAAESFGWGWAIVRGVSDGSETELPGGIDRCVDQRGRTRAIAIAGALLRRPGSARAMLRLRRVGGQAMRGVGQRVIRLCERLAASAG